MADESIEVTFRSLNDVDVELQQYGEIIGVSNGGKYNIPEKYVLHSVNGQTVAGSGLASVSDVEKHVIKCQDSYPLTLKFKKNINDAKFKTQHHLKLPVPENFFGTYPNLTSDEIKEYTKLAKSWVDSLLHASSSSEGFDFVCTKEGVDIYQGKVPGSKIHLIRGTSRIKATKDEMKALMIAPSTDSFRRLFHMIDAHFLDGLLLHQFPENYQHPDVPYFGIKWAIFGAPGPVSARDVCWLEYGDIRKDKDGNEFGFGVASSINRPECPELSHLKLVRSDMLSSGYVFRRSEDNEYLNVTYVIQADPKGWIPVLFINIFAWQQGLNLARIRTTCEGINKAKIKMDENHSTCRNGAPVQGVLISAGQSYNIDITVDEDNCTLSFGFSSENHNIDFQVQGLPNCSNQWATKKRYDCQTEPVSGKVSVKKGQYTLHMDNSFSWLRAKQVYYWYNTSLEI